MSAPIETVIEVSVGGSRPLTGPEQERLAEHLRVAAEEFMYQCPGLYEMSACAEVQD